MNGLAVKDVDFNGAILRAAQDTNNIIWVGVKWVCEGLGLSDGQIKRERKRLSEDLVLLKGGRNLALPTNGGNQEVLCLMLDFLPNANATLLRMFKKFVEELLQEEY